MAVDNALLAIFVTGYMALSPNAVRPAGHTAGGQMNQSRVPLAGPHCEYTSVPFSR